MTSTRVTTDDGANPFLRYRRRLDSYRSVGDGGLDDGAFVELVADLDQRVADVDGHGFVVTPLVRADELAADIGLDRELWIKDDTGNVAGSHKARHLFGTALQYLVDEAQGEPRRERLAIASCGNAALAAGVVAAALGRPLDVFVPVWADDGIVARLEALDASVTRCPRVEGEVGDPAYLRFAEAVADGAHPFSVQGTDNPTAFDGGRTLGWEVADQLAGSDRTDPDMTDTDQDGRAVAASLFLQVGGGAMATAFSLGVGQARLFPVQAEGCAPLRRAWDRLLPDLDMDEARNRPDDYMWAWESEPHSAASGILDDVTYDWIPLLERAVGTGGEPVVAPESLVLDAHRKARTLTKIAVTATGSAGLAGLLTYLAGPGHAERLPEGPVVLGFTGLDRG
jgi:threonine synthase